MKITYRVEYLGQRCDRSILRFAEVWGGCVYASEDGRQDETTGVLSFEIQGNRDQVMLYVGALTGSVAAQLEQAEVQTNAIIERLRAKITEARGTKQ